MGRKPEWLSAAAAGAAAGALNGFFGGGGGMVLVPMLTGLCGLSQQKAFATSVAVILPLCAVSAVIYLLRGGMEWGAALPYLLGGTLGGFLGGKWFRKADPEKLRKGFALLILYGGAKALFF